MIIGIDASRAFLSERTGIEEYSYQVIKNLVDKLNNHQIFLYLPKNQKIDFELPKNWKVKIIKWPKFWTQGGLALELLFHPVDILFIPAHTVPWIHPKNTVVTIHGLEYEILPQAYSFWQRIYMRWSIKKSCSWASKIIAVSENTKKDLMHLYSISENKIKIIYEGRPTNYELDTNLRIIPNTRYKIQDTKYLLFIGRLEERKNIIGVIRAFEILKEKYQIQHKLVLAGKFGYGQEKIKREIKKVNCARDIILTSFIKEKEKWQLLKNADVFLFPTFYEGFGLPILEAQSVGVPVVASNNSSIPEVAGTNHDLSAQLVYPDNAEFIADATYKLISDKNFRDDIIEKGHKNVERFSWEKCASLIAELLRK